MTRKQDLSVFIFFKVTENNLFVDFLSIWLLYKQIKRKGEKKCQNVQHGGSLYLQRYGQ